MKRNLKTLNLPSYLLYKTLVLNGSKLITLEKETSQAILKSHFWRIAEMIIHRDRKVTNKLRVYHRFVLYLLYLNKKNGTLFVVKYLKASLLAIQKVIAGTPVSSLSEIEPDLPLPRLSKGGLPAWIGTRDRRAIMSGSKSVVQFYLSMYSLHRVIDAPVKANLSTITDEFCGNTSFLEGSLGFFKTCFKDLNKGLLKMKPAKLLFLQTSSPSNSFASWQGYGRDALALRNERSLWIQICDWLKHTNNFSLLHMLQVSISKGIPHQRELRGMTGLVDLSWRDKDGKLYLNSKGPISSQVEGLGPRFNILGSWTKGFLLFQVLKPNSLSKKPLRSIKLWLEKESLSKLPKVSEDYNNELLQLPGNTLAPLGRLSFKEEAAGKLRIFAMVDGWTQSIFKPLHDALFDLLKKIPNDATFDQDAAFKRAISKSQVTKHCFGYDLSSATDRLPIIIQGAILEGLIGRRLAALWQLILVNRDYYIPTNKYGISVKSVRYAVGQPMGALSSWAMLALCHHGIVQYASKLIGQSGWCTDYEVLGDDIVIFSPPLAKKYVELMKLFGVSLNMAKSVISHKDKPVVEFAKRTSLNGVDVSPISLKMFLNQDTFSGRIAIFDWFRRRTDKVFIWSCLKTIFKATRWDDRPLKNNFVILAVFSTFIQNGVIPFEWLVRHWVQTRSLLLSKKSRISFQTSLGWYCGILKNIFYGKSIVNNRVKSYLSSVESRAWFRVFLLNKIYSRAKFAFGKDPSYYGNLLMIRCNLLTWRDLGSFLILRKRYPTESYFVNLITKDLEQLQNIFFDNSLLTLDVDELLVILEKVEKFVTLIEILDKPKVPKKKTDSLKILALFDKLLNSGFKNKANFRRMYDILNRFNPPYIKVDRNSEDFISPFFDFVRDYIPYNQTQFIELLIIRNIESKNLEFSVNLLRKLVLRTIDDPWDDTKLYMGPYIDNKGQWITKFTHYPKLW